MVSIAGANVNQWPVSSYLIKQVGALATLEVVATHIDMKS